MWADPGIRSSLISRACHHHSIFLKSVLARPRVDKNNFEAKQIVLQQSLCRLQRVYVFSVMRLLSILILFLVLNSAINAQRSYTIYFRSYYLERDSQVYSGGADLILAIKDSQSYTYSPTQKPEFPLGSSYIPKSRYFNVNKKLLIDPYGYKGELKTYALIIFDFPTTKWEITNEKKVILGDTCIKAKGKIQDIDIIAWYSPRLPQGFGIYNYVGLPGTVLETYMVEKKLQTVAIWINETSPDIVEPTYAKRVSEKTYRRKRSNSGNTKIYWKEKDFMSK